MPDKRSSKKKNWFNSLLAYLYSKIYISDSVKSFFADLFIRITLFKSYKTFEKELASLDAEQRKHQIQSAINSKNVAIASIGLGFGYMGIHFSQFLLAIFSNLSWKGVGVAAGWTTGGLILAGIALPVVLYLWASRLQARALFLKNLAYEESKSKYNKEIEELKKNITHKLSKKFTAQLTTQFIAQFTAQRTFLIDKETAEEHAGLLVKFHGYLENEIHEKIKNAIKNAIENTIAKTNREFDGNHAKLISYYKMQSYLEPIKKFTRSLMLFTAIFALEAANLMFSGFIIPSLVGATLFAILDFRSKEIDHDLKLRRKHEHLIALKKLEIELDNNKDLLNDFQVENINPTDISNTPSGYKYIDYFLAGMGLTSAYAAVSIVTVFNFHEMSMFKGQTLINIGLGGLTFADAILFGGAGIVALGIAIWTIVETKKLYQFYEEEKQRLNQENNRLIKENEYLVTKRGCQKPAPADLTMSGSLKALTKDGKNDLDKSEGIKKTVRVLVYLLIFLGTTGGLAATPFVLAMIGFAILVGFLDYFVRRNKSMIEDEINGLKMQQLHLLDNKTKILASYDPKNDTTLQPDFTKNSKPVSVPQLTPNKSQSIINSRGTESVNGSKSGSPVSDIDNDHNLGGFKSYFDVMRATRQPTMAAASNDNDSSNVTSNSTVISDSPSPSPSPSDCCSVTKSILAHWHKTKLHLITPPTKTLLSFDKTREITDTLDLAYPKQKICA